jgi:hypothetical protein
LDAKPDLLPLTTTKVIGGCLDNYTLTCTWGAKDHCNIKSSASQIITIQDTNPPTLTSTPAMMDITVECGDTFPTPLTVTAKDQCDPNAISVIGPVVSHPITTCMNRTGTWIREWVAKDRCDNVATM